MSPKPKNDYTTELKEKNFGSGSAESDHLGVNSRDQQEHRSILIAYTFVTKNKRILSTEKKGKYNSKNWSTEGIERMCAHSWGQSTTDGTGRSGRIASTNQDSLSQLGGGGPPCSRDPV